MEVLLDELERFVKKEIRNLVTEKFKKYGFSYVTQDLEGYRTGSMNETLGENVF